MLASIVSALGEVYVFAILIYVIMSWIPQGSVGVVEDIRNILGKVCDPYLDLFRRFIPPIGMIDFSPIVALIVLQFAVRIIVRLLSWI